MPFKPRAAANDVVHRSVKIPDYDRIAEPLRQRYYRVVSMRARGPVGQNLHHIAEYRVSGLPTEWAIAHALTAMRGDS